MDTEGLATKEAAQPLPLCAICGDEMICVHNQFKFKICVCDFCGTTLTIPDNAWLKTRMRAREEE